MLFLCSFTHKNKLCHHNIEIRQIVVCAVYSLRVCKLMLQF